MVVLSFLQPVATLSKLALDWLWWMAFYLYWCVLASYRPWGSKSEPVWHFIDGRQYGGGHPSAMRVHELSGFPIERGSLDGLSPDDSLRIENVLDIDECIVLLPN